MAEAEHGGFKAILMRNGNLLVQVLCYGLMENVSVLCSYSFLKLIGIVSVAGAGKSVIWCDYISIVCFLLAYTSG